MWHVAPQPATTCSTNTHTKTHREVADSIAAWAPAYEGDVNRTRKRPRHAKHDACERHTAGAGGESIVERGGRFCGLQEALWQLRQRRLGARLSSPLRSHDVDGHGVVAVGLNDVQGLEHAQPEWSPSRMVQQLA